MTDDNKDQPAAQEKTHALAALDYTSAELDALVIESVRCGNTLETDVSGKWIGEMMPLVQKLHELRVFEGDIREQYHIDATKISDNKGTLDAVMEQYGVILNSLINRLESNDFSGVSRLLINELPRVLGRIRDLVPKIRTHVDACPA